MPILYRMHQDNRKNSAHKGKWYARAVMNGTVGIDEVAEVIDGLDHDTFVLDLVRLPGAERLRARPGYRGAGW